MGPKGRYWEERMEGKIWLGCKNKIYEQTKKTTKGILMKNNILSKFYYLM